jgi:hypothetical protein
VIRHVVLFTLATEDAAEKLRHAEEMKRRLEPLAAEIPGVLGLEVAFDLGRVPGHWDVVLVSEHESEAALESYQAHPRHREAVAFVDSVVGRKACVDYVLERATRDGGRPGTRIADQAEVHG